MFNSYFDLIKGLRKKVLTVWGNKEISQEHSYTPYRELNWLKREKKIRKKFPYLYIEKSRIPNIWEERKELLREERKKYIFKNQKFDLIKFHDNPFLVKNWNDEKKDFFQYILWGRAFKNINQRYFNEFDLINNEIKENKTEHEKKVERILKGRFRPYHSFLWLKNFLTGLSSYGMDGNVFGLK